MTLRSKILLFGLLFLGLALIARPWWWNTRTQWPPFKIVLRGSRSYTGNLGISSGNLVVEAPKPGMLFGTVRKPGSQEQFTYLILFRYGRSKSDGSNQGTQFHSNCDGRKAESNDVIELNGKRIEAGYRIELDQKLTAVANESLTIGGKSVDMTSGQVFLIDLTAETPTYQQKKLELPAISKLESAQDAEELAEVIRKSLESQDPELRAFLR
jgi:hypothetical protein